MPPLDDYLSDSESARICGVSISTLNRFIETGYLKVEHDHDGLRLFSKNQLKRVFGVGESAFTKQTKINRPLSGNTAAKLEEIRVVVPKEPVRSETSPIEAIQPEKQPHLKIVTNQEVAAQTIRDLPITSRAPESTPAPIQMSQVPEITPATQSAAANSAPQIVSIQSQPDPELTQKVISLENENQMLEMEATKLQNVITLLEKMLEIRESEIDSLKRQQQWLEARVEKMEERSHREQLLLLAESETVRKLVVLQKRSPVRAALEWLGLAESTEPRNHIEADRS